MWKYTLILQTTLFFLLKISVCLTFSWIELQMLLRCCLIPTNILFFQFSLIFIVINHKISFKQMYLFFVHFLEYLLLFLDNNVDEESE